MIISNQRLRLQLDASNMGSGVVDMLTGSTPQFWNSTDLQFELGIFFGSTLLSMSNIDSITVDVKQGDPRDGLPLMSATISSGALNQSLSLSAWQAGAPADCHALVTFTNAQSNLALNDDSQVFWLDIYALTSDSPAHRIPLGACPVTVVESGAFIPPPASVVNPTYYTAAQSDARYAMTVSLTSINSSISTLNSEMTAVTATANAALPKAGGTMSRALTITGLSGVLKAPSGVITGGATTDDLTEGSTNLYCSQAHWNTRAATVIGAASGICPLDSGSLVPTSYLPPLAITQTFVVASQVAMLALSATQGDVAIRTDIAQSFILTNNTPSVLGNWSQLLTPASAVTSVNSQTGAVTLTTSNLAEGTNLYYTTARAQADAIAAVLTGINTGSGGTVTSADTILGALGKHEYRMALNDAKTSAAGAAFLTGATFTGPVQFSGSTNGGLVLANLTDTQRGALTPANGMMLYDTTLSQLMYYNGQWSAIVGGSGTTWLNGSGAPASGLGVNGSYYLRTDTGAVYLKSSGTWSVIWAALGVFGSTWSTTITNSNQNLNIISSAASAGAFTLTTAANVTNDLDVLLASGSIRLATTKGIFINNIQVLADQQPNFATLEAGSITSLVQSQGHTSGTTGIDNEARKACDAILQVLRAHGLMAT